MVILQSMRNKFLFSIGEPIGFPLFNDVFIFLNRLKSGIYYPYIAFELVVSELDIYCATWNTSKKLPLSPLTINERLLYKNLYPKKDFSVSSKLILCSIIDQFLQLIDFLKDSKTTSTQNTGRKCFARFTIDIEYGSIPEIDLLNSEATTKYQQLILFITTIFC